MYYEDKYTYDSWLLNSLLPLLSQVVPPFEGVPADEAPCRAPVADFDFKRLGNRLTSLLISPWVANGSAVQEPKGPTKTSQFELSSVPATVKTLFNLTSFLTKRDA